MTPKLLPMGISEFLNLQTPPKTWQVQDLIPLGSLVLLSAREKSGKGLLGIDLAAAVAEGTEFLGLPTLPGNAMYLAAEEPISELQERVRARLGDNQNVPFSLVHLDGSTEGTLDLTRDVDARVLEELIDGGNVNLLVVDVLREVNSAQGDSSTEMSPVMKRLRTIAHNQSCTIVVTHHDSKGGGARGSTAITGGVDIVMQMETDSNSASLEGTLTAKGRGVPAIKLNISYSDDARWHGTPNNGFRAPVRQTAEEKIVRALIKSTVPMSVDEIVEMTEIRRSTAANTMTKLQEKHPDFLQRNPGPGKGSPMQYLANLSTIPANYSHLQS